MNNVAVSWGELEEPLWAERVEPFIQSVLTRLNHTNWDLSVLFCDDAFIKTLNQTYRHIDSPTDVLSFEQGDEYEDEHHAVRFTAGDIVISIDMLKTNAETFAVSVDEELKRLLIHGILHLSGMDHSDNSPEQEMLVLQEQILALYTETVIYQE